MQYALDSVGSLIEATRGARATCPGCRETVLAKCGEVVVHHWAHEAGTDCDVWSEGESQWHRDWKAQWPLECREVVIGCHRADVLTPEGVVVEIQHSPISTEDIEAREAHYRDMVWLFDAREAADGGRVHVQFCGPPWGILPADKITWAAPRRSVAYCKAPVYLDVGDGWVFEVESMDTELGTWKGRGHLLDARRFVERVTVRQKASA